MENNKKEFLEHFDESKWDFYKKYPKLFFYYDIGTITLEDLNTWYSRWESDLELFQLTIKMTIATIEYKNYDFTIHDVMNSPDKYIEKLPTRPKHYIRENYLKELIYRE